MLHPNKTKKVQEAQELVTIRDFFVPQRFFSRPLKVFSFLLVLLLLFSLSIPNSLFSAQAAPAKVNTSSPTLKTKDDKGIPKLELNPEYKNPNSKETSLQAMQVEPSTFENGTALNARQELATISEEQQKRIKDNERKLNDEELAKKLIESRRTAKEDKARATDTKKVFTSDDGIQHVKQKLVSDSILNEKGEKVTLDTTISESIENSEKILKQGNGVLKPKFQEISKKGVTIGTPEGEFSFRAIDAQKSQPTQEANAVVYKNVWDGVDVVYEYKGSAIKEFIVLQKRPKTNSFSFEVTGAEMKNSPDVKNGIDLFVGKAEMRIEPPHTIVKNLGPV